MQNNNDKFTQKDFPQLRKATKKVKKWCISMPKCHKSLTEAGKVKKEKQIKKT